MEGCWAENLDGFLLFQAFEHGLAMSLDLKFVSRSRLVDDKVPARGNGEEKFLRDWISGRQDRFDSIFFSFPFSAAHSLVKMKEGILAPGRLDF